MSGWSVVSALGMGAAAFTAGVRAGRRAVSRVEADHGPLPVPAVGLVPQFSPSAVLGKKGTRSMDRATGLAVTAVRLLLEHEPGLVAAADGEVGLVLGTTMGSVESTMAFTCDSLTQEKPYHVDPARFPNTVMNCAAGQCAIWHRLRGPNATIAGGHVSTLLALNYAVRLQRCGHVETVLCGAVEEFSAQRSWLEWHSQGPGWAPGEACGVFLLEPSPVAVARGREPLAEVLALEFGVHGEDVSPREALAACVRKALDGAGLSTQDVWAVSPSGGEGPDGVEEEAALTDVFDGCSPRRAPSVELVGDTGAASGAVQLAAVLALAGGDARAHRQAALVTSIDLDGLLGCALVRMA
ncbi:MAG: 3-oxoacyl-ACP synthase [Actinomycetota bacterium]|nr:3-oxoacyl-ACP synthase [Actinomycetota bacterium]